MGNIEQSTITTSEGINSDVYTLNLGPSKLTVYSHGAINDIEVEGQDVTFPGDLNQKIVHFSEIYRQRFGNPLMNPAGRYGDEEDLEQRPQRVSQPGLKDIHGVIAGIPWDIVEAGENFIEMRLPAERWKGVMEEYYIDAAKIFEVDTVGRHSLDRFIRAILRSDKSYEVVDSVLRLRTLIGTLDIDKKM